MILTENIALRLHEWLDRDEEPDLVPRLRRLWKERPVSRPPDRVSARSVRRLLRRTALQPRPGV